MSRVLFPLFAAVLITLMLTSACAGREIANCTEIRESGVYYLANDISENAVMCIIINVNDVVLDGNGHVVVGNGTGYGIYAEGVENVTVKNLILTNWSYGIYLEIDRGGVENVNVANSAVDGIYINGSSDVAIRGVVSDSNGETGIVVHSCDSITMEDAVARGNGGSGILLRSTASSTLRNVTAVSNTYYGIWLDNASNNVLSEINASYNLRKTPLIGGYIHITSSDSNVIANVTVKHSFVDCAKTRSGIFVERSSNTEIINTVLQSDNQLCNTGVFINGYWGNSENLTLKNVTVRDFGFGIFLYTGIGGPPPISGVVIEDVHVSGAYWDGITVESPLRVTIRNSVIENVGRDGIFVAPLGDMPNSNFSIINTTIENAGRYGIYFYGTSSGTSSALGGVLIDNVVIRNVTEYGIYDREVALGLGNNTIRNTIIENVGAGSGNTWSEAGAGIFVGTLKSTTGEPNWIINVTVRNTGYGIITGWEHVVNSTFENVGWGVYTHAPMEGLLRLPAEVRNNRIVNAHYSTGFGTGGIAISYVGDWTLTTVENNTVINSSGYGIRIIEENIVISNNTVINSSMAGIFVGEGSNTVVNNTIAESTVGIYVNTDTLAGSPADNNAISGNTITGSTTGILVKTSSNTISNNTITGSATGIKVSASNNIIAKNTLANNTWDIHVTAANNAFENNLFGSVNANFTYSGEIMLASTSAPASDPGGYRSLNKQLRLNLSSGAWLNLSVSYTENEIPAGATENDLLFMRYSSPLWSELPSSVNTADNYVNANITSDMLSPGDVVDVMAYIVGGTPITACTVIDQPGTYYLANDISGSATCINVTASDVAIYGRFHSITGSDTDNTYGVYAANVSNVTITDLSLRDWKHGVYLINVSGATVDRVNTKSNLENGIRFEGCRDVEIEGVVAEESDTVPLAHLILIKGSTNVTIANSEVYNPNQGSAGIFLNDSSDIRILNYKARGRWVDTYGIVLYRTSNVLIDNADISGFDHCYSDCDAGIALYEPYWNSPVPNRQNNLNNITILNSRITGNWYGITTAPYFSPSGFEITQSITGLTIRNTTIENNNEYGIYISKVDSLTNFTIENSTIADNERKGILIGYMGKVTDVTIENTTIADSGGYGIYIFAMDSLTNFTIENSTITNNWIDGILITEVDLANHVTIENSTIADNGGDGIFIDVFYGDFVNVAIRDNTIESDGIYIIGDHGVNLVNVAIRDNTIESSRIYIRCGTKHLIANNTIESGRIYIEYGTKHLIANNTVRNSGGAAGIEVKYQSGAVVENNTLIDTAGIYLVDSGNSQVVNNSVVNLTRGGVGIHLERCGNSTVKNNTLLNATTAIVLESSGGGSQVKNNILINATWYFRLVYSWKNTTLDNLIGKNESSLVRLSIDSFRGDLQIGSVASPPSPPQNYKALGDKYYLTIENLTSQANAHLTLFYSDADISALDERTMKIWRYNGSAWQAVAESGANVNENYVYANITNFSVFAPLGEEDTTPPVITFVDPTPADGTTLKVNHVLINVTASEDLSKALLEWNGVNHTMLCFNNSCHLNMTGLANGDYSYRVYGFDFAGNLNSTELRVVTIAVPDTTPPAITIISPESRTYSTSTIQINVTASDPSGIAEVKAEIDGTTNITLQYQNGYYVNSTTLPDGDHSIRIHAKDNAGNIGNAVVYFSVKTTVTTPTGGAGGGRAGGGGAGGGVFIPPPLEAPSEVKYTEARYFPANKEVALKLPSKVTETTGAVEIVAKIDEARTLSMTISKAKELPENVPNPPYKVYKIFEVVFAKYGTAIKVEPTGRITFRVAKDWMAKENVDQILLMKYNPAKAEWMEIPTAKVGEDDDYVYFRSDLQSFSLFAIVGTVTTPAATPTITTTAGEELSPEESTSTPSPPAPPFPPVAGFVAAAIVAMVVVAYLIRR